MVHTTYQSVSRALQLLEDTVHWDHTLEQVTIPDFPINVWELFAVMLVFCQLVNPLTLWVKHRWSFRRSKDTVGKSVYMISVPSNIEKIVEVNNIDYK